MSQVCLFLTQCLHRRRISNVTHRIEAATRRSMGTPTHVGDDGIGEPEIESFCVSASALQQLMSSERVLMIGIVPHQYQKKIFEIITRESVDAVVREGSAIFIRLDSDWLFRLGLVLEVLLPFKQC